MKHTVNSSSSTSRIQSPTFKVAFWALMAVAALQIIGVIWKVVPATIIRVTTPSPVMEVDIVEAYRPAAPVATPTEAPPREAPVDPVLMQEAMTFVTQADKDARVGDWESVLSSIAKAVEIMGPNPRLLLQQAFAMERLGREVDSAALLNQILTMPDLDPETRNETLRLRNYVTQTIGNLEASGIATSPSDSPIPDTTTSIENTGRSPMAGPVIESIGLQPGANLGIVEVREIDGDGTKTLRVAIKSRPGTAIDAADVKVSVRFFEQGPEGEVFLTQERVTSEWISPPVDWADNEPEILDVVYPLTGDSSTNAFHGYTVAIYFRDELQDTRAVPGSLDQQFPAELFLENLMP
jgi:hypothetical protein